MKLFYGLWGCSDDGTLYTPSGRRVMRLPRRLAFAIHRFVNRFGYVGIFSKN